MCGLAKTSAAKRFTTEDINWSLSDAVLNARRNLARATSTPQVIKIKEIIASIEELRAIALPGKVIVQGVVLEQIFFVGPDGIVRERVERVPFAEQVVLPGVDPEKIQSGAQVLDVQAEVEFVIAHLVDDTRVVDKIVILLTLTLTEKTLIGGIPFDVVIATKKQQVLVVRIKVFPVKQVIVVQIPVAAVIRKQILIVTKKQIPAIKIKRVDAEVRNVAFQALAGKLIVSGILHKQVAFVGPDNVVRMQEEDIPFTEAIPVPGLPAGAAVSGTVVVEFLIPELDVARGILVQKTVLLVQAAVPTTQMITVVSDVIAPDVQVTKIQIEVEGEVFTVVTDVTGPGVISVKKQTIMAVVVGSGNPNPQPVTVVVDVVLDP